MPRQRILLTGADGFVGRHLLPPLRAAFPVADLLATGRNAVPGLRQLDVTDAAAVDAAIAAWPPTDCIHLAAIAVVPQASRSPELAWRVNLHGTLTLADALVRHAPGCRLLHVSSADVYGRSFAAGTPLDESALPAPMNAYGATKAAADLAIGAMAGERLHAIRLRPFNHTGPAQSAEFVVPAFARQVARIEAGLQPPRLAVGALDPARDFLDVRDVCAAYIACLREAATIPPGTILNIASGIPRRIGGILDDLLAMAGITAEIAVEPGRLRASEIPVACGDATRARGMLGWEPQMAWEDTLAAVLADWRRRAREEAA
ncbi:MAG: GDP-mannose 4,6-dehydratase [Alphaproteobacteria bacterium]|nr:GDP-mannose 4,6-dehydratase [Alphaproteobacteria bacterium]